MERYDSYKDSGVEWIGEIPSHWSKIKLKNTVDPNRKITYGIVQPGKEDPTGTLMIRGKDYSNGWVDVSEVFRVSPKIELPYSRSRVKSGDIVYTIVGGVGNVEVVPKEYEGSNLTQTTGRISVKDGINSKWVYHSLQSELNPVQIKLSQVGSVIPGISLDTLKNFIVLLPPLSEQQQIVSFLDTKTSLIDSLIEKTQRKIELLKEKRTSLINEVVTKGLNPNVEMKDSGVEWIGEIPSGWLCIPIKYVTEGNKDSIRTGPFGSSLKSDEFKDEGIRVYNQRSVYDEDFSKSNLFVSEEKYQELKSFDVIPKDVLITSRGTIGRMTVVPDDGEIGVLHPCLIRLRLNREIISDRFLWFYMNQSSLFLNSVLFESNSTTIEVIYSESLSNVRFPLPPLSEQQQIVEYLDEQTQKIDNTISIEEKRIELLKEYRQSLISEVVTGKRKVVE